MADPFTALGAAGNIVQFLDFGSKLFSKGKEIYKSVDGSAASNIELELIYRDLCHLSKSLAAHSPTGTQGTTGRDTLEQLLVSCQDLAQELLTIVEGLKITPNQKHRKWRSFRQALKSAWKQNEIDELEKRLDGLRTELSLHLATIFGERQAEIIDTIRKFHSENSRLNLDQTKRLQTVGSQLERIQDTVDLVQKGLFSKEIEEDILKLNVKIDALAISGIKLAKEQRILSSLPYKYMRAREARITDAFAETFEWIYSPHSNIGFVNWLENPDGIFWIAGKPGSGKSTLMKYLCGHPKTIEGLQKWSGNARLVTAHFFFWSIGTYMQKSQEGLLRSLLFEMFRQCPEMMPDACPDLWNSYDGDGFLDEELWNLDELKEAIARINRLGNEDLRFCFFIDGLDEYEGHHLSVIRDINALASSPFIKICVSSRSWQVFEDAYGSNHECKIYLEDLTMDDIARYVRSNLEQHTMIAIHSLVDTKLDELVDRIVHRAQGVFLWIYLVVMSLCDGLTNGDNIELLQARLDEIPTDLEMYFRHILQSVETVYQRKMAETFQIMLQAPEPLTLMALSFLEQNKPYFALNLTIQEIDQYDIFIRHREMRRRIRGRYKGLLDITTSPSETDFFASKVDFFHRTVHDFMRLNNIQKYLKKHLRPEFNTHLTLCELQLSIIKRMPVRINDITRTGYVHDILSNFMYHARQLEIETGQSPIELIDETESTILHHANKHKVRHILYRSHKNSDTTFFECAIRSCLQVYAYEKLKGDKYFVRTYPKSLLHLVLNQLHAFQQTQLYNSQVRDMVVFLLEQGADPNQLVQGTTVFSHFLLRILDINSKGIFCITMDREKLQQQLSLLNLLIEHGADPNGSISKRDDRLDIFFMPDTALTRASTTMWGSILQLLWDRKPGDPALPKAMFNIIEILISAGADLEIHNTLPRHTHLSPVTIISRTFPNPKRQTLITLIKRKRSQKIPKNRGCNVDVLMWVQSITTAIYLLAKPRRTHIEIRDEVDGPELYLNR